MTHKRGREIVLDAAADLFGWSPAAIMGKDRYDMFMSARFAVYVALSAAHNKYVASRVLGRDESTVRHGVERGWAMMAEDPEYAAKVAKLRIVAAGLNTDQLRREYYPEDRYFYERGADGRFRRKTVASEACAV